MLVFIGCREVSWRCVHAESGKEDEQEVRPKGQGGRDGEPLRLC